MSLVKQPVMTEANRSARRQNAQKSRGAATPQGKERARDANLRHGIYSQARDEALLALGEDPAELAALLEGAYEQWRPANQFQASLVERMGRLQWRMQRAERMQENLTAEHVRKVGENRHEKVMQSRYKYVDKVDFLAGIQRDALRPDFYAPPAYFQRLTKAFAGEIKGGMVDIMELLHRLQEPQPFPPAPGELPPQATSDSDWEQKLAILEEEDEGFRVPQPDVPVAEGPERDASREQLLELAAQEQRELEAVWDPIFERYQKPLTPTERDQAASEWDHTLDLLRRQEESCFRQFWRLGTFLMKIQKSGDRSQETEARRQETGVGSPRPGWGVGKGDSDSCLPAPNSCPSKNAGASGDVDENTVSAGPHARTIGPAPAVSGGQEGGHLTTHQPSPTPHLVNEGAPMGRTGPRV